MGKTSKGKTDHAKYLRSTKAKKVKYEGTEPAPPLPWADGKWAKHVTIGNGQTTVTFKLQQGSFTKNGYNGCYPVQLVRFALQLYKSYEKRDRETSMIITDLENAVLHDCARSVRLEEENTHGTGTGLVEVEKK